MRVGGFAGIPFAAISALVAAGLGFAMTGTLAITGPLTEQRAGRQQMPDIRYRGLKSVLILAQYGPAGEVAGGAESEVLCREVAAVAAVNAPVPVTCAAIGDPRIGKGDAMILSVQASVSRVAGNADRLFAVTAHATYAGGLDPQPAYFGAAPSLARFAETEAGRADRARAIGAALDQVLPWRRGGVDAVGVRGE